MGDDSSSNGSFGSSEWTMYANRPDWSDVKPIKQDDGPDPIVKIAYSDNFVDVFDYFRAIYASKEVSERALDLTKDAAVFNPANYTVWHHRRFLLKALGSNLNEELDYIRGTIEEHPKNYQVWQHRRALVEWLNDPSLELRLTEIILSGDPKNYHAWQHRQWVVQTFKLQEGELEYVERLLEDDVRNNSAWNQRFFLLSEIKGEVLERELKFTMDKIKVVTNNESAWNYLRGLLDRCDDADSLSAREKCRKFCQELLESVPKDKTPPSYLLAAIVDLHSDRLELEGDKLSSEEKEEELKKAKELCQKLAKEVDTIRKEYWNFFYRDLTLRFGGASGAAKA